MDSNNNFFISLPIDPFTLLKLFQQIERLEVGGAFDLVFDGQELPPKLSKMLLGGAVEVSPVRSSTKKGFSKVTLTKRIVNNKTNSESGGSCCSS